MNIPKPLDIDYCPTCTYPLKVKPCIICQENERNAKKQTDAQIAALGGLKSFNEYTAERFAISPKTSAAFSAASAFDPAKDNLLFTGPAGSGKSHLAIVAARKYMHKRLAVVKTMDVYRADRGCDADARAERAVIKNYVDQTVLVIDDLGIGKDTEFAITTLYEIIDGRYMAGMGGLIVTSNLSLGDLAIKLGEDRIVSRLAEMCRGHIYSFEGEPDHRLMR